MDVIIKTDPKERLFAIPKTRIRLNVLVEHPKGNWKRIQVTLNYNAAFGLTPSEHQITSKNDIGMSSISEEVVVPDKLGEFPIGEVNVRVNNDERSQYLPTVRILSEEGYFEQMVAERLRELEFEAVRLGGPRKPDVETSPKKDLSQRAHVEGTLEDYYELSKFRNDTSKFREWRRARQYKRLIIVTYTDRISEGVARALRRTHDPISLIRYRDLETLASMFEKGLVSIYQVQFLLLGHTGIVQVDALT